MAKKKSPALRSVGDALTSPQTRQERYLANIAGLVATKPEYPFTRLERYLDAIAQSTGGSAETIEELKRDKLNVYGRGVNLLDNWYFVGGGSQLGDGIFPINQRGQTSYSGEKYGIDRWKGTTSGTSVVVENDRITFSGINARLRQLVSLPSNTYTLSVLAKSTAGNSYIRAYNGSTEVGGKQISASSQYSLYSVTFTNSITEVRFLTTSLSDTMDIVAVKLELGDTQTLAHQDANGNWVLNDPPPNFQQELAKCQRYFQVFRDQNLRPAYGMDYRPPMAKEQPTQSSFVLDDVIYYTASAEL